MDGMQDMYGQPYGQIDPTTGYPQDASMSNLDGMAQAQTLDQIMSHNHEELMRRSSAYNPDLYRPNAPDRSGSRRQSMMEFGTSDLADFQFDPNPAPPPMSQQQLSSMSNMSGIPSTHHKMDPRRVRSKENLALHTQFSQMNTNYNDMNSFSPQMVGNMTGDPNEYMGTGMDLSMGFDQMAGNATPMDVSAAMQQSLYTDSPVAANFNMNYSTPSNPDPGGGSNASPHHSMGHKTPQSGEKRAKSRICANGPGPISMRHASSGSDTAQGMQSPMSMGPPPARRMSMDRTSFPSNMQEMTMGQLSQMPMMQGPNDPAYSKFANAYSTTGFDMLGVLMRVATRRKPEINIGPVDLSCAFVVCDIDQHDLPIVYCSDMFERLTGYTRYEILGRNCRFLQAPDGKVQSGIKRKYVDDQSVLYLKNQINKRAEAQLSLINYRKGGQPFMNLLTMIPITWDTEEFRYFVGFQVDLVEQPGSVSGKNPDGTYAINYNRSSLPAYALPPPPDPSSGITDLGQTIPRDEVSQVLSTIGNGESELSKRIWDKVLLENTDDVVHVLSLKGLFLYLSPSSRTVLEYDPADLVGTPLSSVCHPSDIVPVTRELKDSAGGAAVNVVYRIRRKRSGYTWFEAHGCLHTEQGKGRKCMIMVGRERPVYALDRQELSNDGGIGDSELWSKLSTSGMFLHISSNSRAMLDRLPDDMVGVSLQSLMRPESRRELQKALESARTGEKATFKHDLQNRRGQVLQAQTTIYPGDAKRGRKPTFLLAQTRLLKMTRAMLLSHKSHGASSTTGFSEGSGTPARLSSQQAMATSSNELLPPGTPSGLSDPGVITQAGSNGLTLGNQDEALASEDNIFDELKTTRSTSWQFELRQMERQNRLLAEELQSLVTRKKKRKRRKGLGQLEKDCANCHTRVTPEWRRGPSGQRDLCNSCGLRWAKQNGRVSPRTKTGTSDKSATSPGHTGATQANANSSIAGNLNSSNDTKPKIIGGQAIPTSERKPNKSPLSQQQNAAPSSEGGSQKIKPEESEGQYAADGWYASYDNR
ncbi:White collar 1 protein [Cyphellophora attinorum]|uniref:White collar 1 protein n=1 Tax=Cyphellophora attinorum TaxID=1664694 RepID=A0A0N1H2R4_9EURO|nr:White collar 1 protein [Phialophora attinorum]KPI34776.1 White collar 1 protein [Phialophora attinorum]